jgi:hypothetical protein
MLMVNSSTIAMGDTPTLRMLVDGRASFTALPERLSALTKEVPYQTQFWGAYVGGPLGLPLSGNLENANKVLGLMGNGIFYFDVRQGVTGTMTGVASNPQDAQQAHDGLVGFLGLGRMMIPKNQSDLARALDGIQVTQDGQRVSVKIAESDELAGTLVGLLLRQ